MPRILESEALALAQNIDAMSDDLRPQALDILTRYKTQQEDFGEPEWPTYAKQQEEAEQRFRSMFDSLKNVDKAAPSLVEALSYAENPDADRARVANTAFLSRVYGKTTDEISGSLELYQSDYAAKRGQKAVDDLGFYKLAAGEVAAMKRKEETALEGAKAALRGEDVIQSLQAWQAKNTDRIPDSTEFAKGYLKAKDRAGDYLPIADELLKLMESQTGQSNSTRTFDAKAAGRIDEIAGDLATMKPRERKQIYASIAARAEAAGYDQKGFWSQMLGELDKGLLRMTSTVGTTAGIALDVVSNLPAMLSNTMKPEEFDATEASIAQRQALGEIHDELASIVSGEVDPVKPTIGWLNDTVETGLIKGPGAVAPFMAATAALGPWGGGMLFTADFAEQNRRDLRAAGLDNDRAIQIGVMAAPLQAAVESLSNMLQLGRFTKLQTVLAGFTRPIGGGAGLALRYAQNAGISLATEYTEEQIQDNFIVPAVQQIVGALAADVPEVDWSFYKTRAAESTPELLSVLAPMALVFGGVMTGAQANLSRVMTSNIDALKALNYSEAQAVEIVAEKSEDARIAKASSLWGSRAGDKTTLEDGAKSLASRMRQLSGDVVAQQQELERRGILPRMLHASADQWRLTFQDGSTAAFNSHREADAARWTWTEDQLGKVHALTRETLASLEKNLDVNREVGVQFSPNARTAQDAVNDGASVDQIKQRVEQGKALGDLSPDAAFEDAQAIDKATAETDDFLSSLQILGSSKNEFKDGILRTTVKLWEGSNVLTLVEEKIEGDAKAIIADAKGREWMLSRLRGYEDVSGDKLFRDAPDGELKDDDIVEAWSHLGQSYLVGRSTFGEPLQKRTMRRFGRLLMRSGLTGAMNAESSFFAAVASRAQKLGELKSAGKLSEDLVSELEKQLGIDSQVSHDAAATKEADAIAAEVVDTSGYSPENPGPNGETFSLAVQQRGGVPFKAGDRVRSLDFEATVYSVEPRQKLGYWVVYTDVTGEPEWKSEDRRALSPFAKPFDAYSEPVEIVRRGNASPIRNEALEALKETGGVSAKADVRQIPIREAPKSSVNYTAPKRKGVKASSIKVGDIIDLGGAQTVTSIERRGSGFLWLEFEGGNAGLFSGDSLVNRASRAVPADASKVVEMPDGAQLVGPTTFSIRAYHGTPHKVDKFTTAKIGTGEGAQAYGWGLYFAENEGVARNYQEQLRPRQPDDYDSAFTEAAKSFIASNGNVTLEDLRSAYPNASTAALEWGMREARGQERGNLYTVELLPDEADFLDWDKPLSEQSDKVKAALASLPESPGDIQQAIDLLTPRIALEGRQAGLAQKQIDQLKVRLGNVNAGSGAQFYNRLGEAVAASEMLAKAGIPGIRYLDAGSRGAGDGTRNFVIFDENLVRILEENGRPVEGETFSLRPGDFESRMAAKFSLFQAKPELRLAIAQVAKERALRLGAEWIAKGDVIRTAKDIGKEQAFREADGFDRRMTAYLDGLTPNARQTLEFEPSALESDPLVSAMLDEGKLMSRSTAVKNGVKNLDEYDGVPWLPPAWYSKGAGITPGKMAKALHDGPQDQGGPLRGDSAQDLWDSLAEVIASTRKDKAAHREAVQAYKDAQKAAKADAKAEAEAWANQARKTAGSPKAQRDMLKAALRTLDGILAAAPPEVRARVGGYVKLAGLATDEAMLAEIERRIDKMNVELEKWLKKEGRAELTRLFKRAAPKNESGEKAQGKIGPEFHAWFALAESAAEMSPEKADEAIVAAEQALEADVTDAQLAGLSAWMGREVSDLDEARTLQDIRLTVLQTFGSTLYSTDAQAPRNAAEIMAAVDAAKEQYIKGRVTHLEKMAARRERRQEWRTKGIALVGGAATGDSARAQMARSPSDLKRLASDYLDTGLDASGFFRSLLGEGDLYQTVRRSILEADAQEQDAMKARRAEFAKLLKTTFAGGKTARLRGLWELQRIQEGTPLGTFSQMQAVQFTLWFQDLDSREWLASHGYGEEWQAKAEKWLTPEAKKIRAWLLEKYGQQYDRINPVFRELRGVNLPRVEAYGGMRQVENMGKDGSVALTADNMAGGMAAGFTKTRVSSPTGPPKNVDALANYWGNAFQVEHYIAWAEPLAEIRAVVGHRDFRMAVESNLGAAKSAQMMRWIDDLEKSGQRNAIMNTLSGDLMQRWGSAASASALLFKVGVLLKQATAALGSAFKVGLGSYARSLGRVLSGASSISLREAWNSDSVQRRINDYDPEMREAFQAHQKRRFENEILDVLTQYPNRALEGGWYAIGFTDAVFTTVSAAVAHDASYREGLAAGLNNEQAMAYAGEQMTLIVKETAQPDSTATKSQFENSVGNPWLRVIFAFQSANRQAFGLSLLSYKHGDKFASRLILGHLIIPIVSQTIGNMIRDGFTDADDDEIWTLKGYLASMLLGPFSGALQLGPLLEVLAQKTFGAEPRVASNPAATALTALGSILEGDFDSGDIGRVVTELGNILGGRASATGAGWNIIRQLLGLQENAENDQ